MASMIVLFLVALKNSPLVIAGLTYDRINSFHRWLGRLIVGIYVVHGIMMGYLQCIQGKTPFKSWIMRQDVYTGVIAASFLVLLTIL